jgi:hypothetical protein
MEDPWEFMPDDDITGEEAAAVEAARQPAEVAALRVIVLGGPLFTETDGGRPARPRAFADEDTGAATDDGDVAEDLGALLERQHYAHRG